MSLLYMEDYMKKISFLKMEYITGFILIPIIMLFYFLFDKNKDSMLANNFLMVISLILNIILLKESKKEVKNISNIKVILISIWLFLTAIIPGIFGFIFLASGKEKKKLLLPEIKEDKNTLLSYIKSIMCIVVFISFILILPSKVDLKFEYTLIIYLLVIIMILLSYFKELKSQFKIFIKNFKVYFPFIIKRYLFMILIMVLVAIPIFFINNGDQAGNQKTINEMMKKAPLFVFLLSTLYAPFAEEGIFRLSLHKIFKNKYVFIIISGLLFGLLHVVGKASNINEFLYVLQYSALGMCLAKAYYDSKNIYVSMSMHFIQNLLAAILSFLLF